MKDEFDELLELEKENRESKDIKKKMNIYFYKRIAIFAVIFTFILGCLYIFNPFKDKESMMTYYDPTELTIEGLDNQTSLGLLLQSFYRTQFSAVELQLHEVIVEEDKYTFRIQEMQDLRHITSGDKEEMTKMIIEKNKLDFTSTMTIMMEEYAKKGTGRDAELSRELSDLKELPDSSVLEVALVFDEKLTAKDLIQFIKKYENVQFVWGCVDMYRQLPYGINLYNVSLYDVNESFDSKYPYLNEFDKYNAEQLHQHYLSSLKLLMDYPELSDLLENEFFNSKDIEEQYNESKDELSFIGVKCYIKKNDLIKAIDSGDFKYGLIEDIRYSKYER